MHFVCDILSVSRHYEFSRAISYLLLMFISPVYIVYQILYWLVYFLPLSVCT